MRFVFRQHTVLVNRGWVPPNWKAEWQEHFKRMQPSSNVRVTGVVQGSENPSGFVPTNDPQQGNYFWVDVQGIVSLGDVTTIQCCYCCICTEAQCRLGAVVSTACRNMAGCKLLNAHKT